MGDRSGRWVSREKPNELAFVVERLAGPEKALVSEYDGRCYTQKPTVYSLSKADLRHGAKYLSLDHRVRDLTDKALELLDHNSELVDECSRTLSSIVSLDMRYVTRRLLLNSVFVRAARLVLARSMILKSEGPQVGNARVVIIMPFDGITLPDCESRTYAQKRGWLFLALCRTALRYLARLALLFVRIIHCVARHGLPHSQDLDVLAVLGHRHNYERVRVGLAGVARTYSVGLVNSLDCRDNLKPFQIEPPVHPVSVVPHVDLKCLRALCTLPRLMSLPGCQQEILGFWDELQYRIVVCEGIASRYTVRLVLVENEYDLLEGVDYQVFRSHGLKYLDFMHGDMLYETREAFHEYDAIAVWGQHYESLERALRCRAGITAIVGNEVFDQISAYRCRDVQLSLLRHQHRVIVSVFTQPTYGFCDAESQISMIQEAAQFVMNQADSFLILKHHPTEYQSPIPSVSSAIPSSMKDRFMECLGEHALYDLLSVSDIVVTPYSTVGLEGVLFRKPVVFMNFGGTSQIVDLSSRKVAFEVNDPAHAQECLSLILSGKLAIPEGVLDSVAHDWACGLDGGSASRFARLVDSLLAPETRTEGCNQ